MLRSTPCLSRVPIQLTGIQLFFDDVTGKTWLTLAKPFTKRPADHSGYPIGSYTCEIDIETGRQLSGTKLVKYSNLGNGIAEGPHVLKRGKYYYLITAEGGTEIEHQEWVCRSTTGPEGPWEVGPSGSVNPMIYNGDHDEIRQTGHMDLVEGVKGQWWAVFLAVRPVWTEKGEAQLSHLGRETFLAPVTWVDDWPIVNNRQPITINSTSRSSLPRAPSAIEADLSFSPEQGKFSRILKVNTSWLALTFCRYVQARMVPPSHTSLPGSLAHGTTGIFGIARRTIRSE